MPRDPQSPASYRRPWEITSLTIGAGLLSLCASLVISKKIPQENIAFLFGVAGVAWAAATGMGYLLIEKMHSGEKPLADAPDPDPASTRPIESSTSREPQLIHEKEKAEADNDAKNRFLACTAHELRTPLNTILGYTSLLSENKQLDQETHDAVQSMRESAEALLCIVGDVLDYTKIEAGKTTLHEENYALDALITRAFRIHRNEALAKHLQAELDIDSALTCQVYSDPGKLQQIISNLLENAVKHTHVGYVKLIASCEEKTEKHIAVKIEVRDSGSGIPEDKKTMLFEPFVQCVQCDTSSQETYHGTGLGLAICKSLVQQLKGTIQCDHEKPQGAHFWFTLSLPLSRPEKVTETTESQNSESITHTFTNSPSILLVEDNAANQVVEQSMLKKLNCQVHIANNGHEAIQAVNQGNYDLVIMDIQMPEMDGFQAIETIRSTFDKDDLKIVAMTAHASKETREHSLSVGFNDYIAKPVQYKQLAQLIHKWTQNSAEV